MRVIALGIAYGLCLIELRTVEVRPLAAFVLGLITMLWWSWFRAFRWAGRLASRMRDPNISVMLNDAGITFQAADASSRLSWAAVGTVRRFRKVWVIEQRDFPVRRAVPAEALTPEAKDLIVRMVRKAGGKVR